MSDPDVVIIGTGPAGVSAAYPLVEAGLQVLMIDGGRQVQELARDASYLDLRRNATSQWKVFLGEQLEAFAASGSNSPKLRSGTLAPVFEGYRKAYQAELHDFTLIGSLAAGGLSNAWGAGVSSFNDADLTGFPIKTADLALSYQAVAARIGLSGTKDDDLCDLFGSDVRLQPPPALDSNADFLIGRYRKHPRSAQARGFRFGLARNAVLTEPLGDREGCDRSTLCLWGCGRRAIYSARFDLERLLRQPNCTRLEMTVETIRQNGGKFQINGLTANGTTASVQTAKVLLAAGTVGTAKLAFDLIGHRNKPVALLSTPSAAFAIMLPHRLGQTHESRAFGLAQLSFSFDLGSGRHGPAFGNVFGTAGLPLYEFARLAPLSRLGALHMFRFLLPAMLVGNCFLPGEFSAHRLMLRDDGRLDISGGYHDETAARFHDIRRQLFRAAAAYGAFLLPGSFSRSEPGSDAHYAGTVPMKAVPAPHECNRDGEVSACPGLYVVDGAALTRLPAKAHTLTIMANADRIARKLAQQLSG